MSLRHAWVVFLLALALVASVLGGTALAPPSIWYVDNTVACNDATTNSSLTPYCTIQAAVGDASSGDTIAIGPGTYVGAGTAVVWLGGEDIDLVGSGEGVTVLDGQASRIGVRIDGANSNVSNLTIVNGHSSGSGGGLYVVNPGSQVVTATDVTVMDSGAAYSGGGALAYGAGSEMHLLRVTIQGCDTSGDGGAGAFMVSDDTVVSITDSLLIDNEAIAGTGKGGAIRTGSGAELTITGATFDGNDAGHRGGAIYIDGGVTGFVDIADSTFFVNGAGGGADDGGGIYLSSGTLTTTGSLFDGNAATLTGGAITVYGGTATITSTTITGNQAGTYGGGIAYLVGSVSGSTVTGNSANDGGGLGGPGADPTVRNSIIAGNSATSGHPDCDEFTSAGYNLIGDTTGCVINGDTTGNVVNQAPLLAALADDGGATKTHALLAGSPAIDAANPVTPNGIGTACESTDQRGWDRDGDEGRCDIGAFELLRCRGQEIDIAGTPGNDTLTGTVGRDVIAGFGGRDTLYGLEGNDILCGFAGNDILYGGPGKDILLGGGKHDVLWGGLHKDKLFGENGTDTLYGQGGDDRIKGGNHADVMFGHNGDDFLYGGPGVDTADGGPGINTCAAEIEISCL